MVILQPYWDYTVFYYGLMGIYKVLYYGHAGILVYQDHIGMIVGSILDLHMS